MLQTLMNRRAEARDNDKGFTLIELMVVVLIIAILLAIAIPTFLGAQNKSKDRSAQTSAKTTLTAAGVLYSDSGSFSTSAAALATALDPIEPNLTFQAGASTGPKVVSVFWVSATEFAAVAESGTGTCFAIRNKLAGGAEGTFYDTVPATAGDCALTAANVPTIDQANW